MKKLTTIIFIVILSLTAHAQIDFDNPPWDLSCDTLFTQTDLNICSFDEYMIADSILKDYYAQLETYLAARIQEEEAAHEDDSDAFHGDLIQQLKDQKTALIDSKSDFEAYKNSTIDFIGLQYEGGSIRSLIVNHYAMELTINQIKVLSAFMDELVQN